MKAKRVTILYIDGTVNNIANTEWIYNRLTNQLLEEGRALKFKTKDKTVFTDGSTIRKIRVGIDELGFDSTHIYVDEKVLELINGEDFIREVATPMVLPKGDYKHLEVVGEASDRLLLYGKQKIRLYKSKD